MDIYREKPIRVSVKVLVPVREHPKVVVFCYKSNNLDEYTDKYKFIR